MRVLRGAPQNGEEDIGRNKYILENQDVTGR